MFGGMFHGWVGMLVTFFVVSMVIRGTIRGIRWGAGWEGQPDSWRGRGGRRLVRMTQLSQEVDGLHAAIQDRDGQIEMLESRLLELETRLDFAERLMSQRGVDAPETHLLPPIAAAGSEVATH